MKSMIPCKPFSVLVSLTICLLVTAAALAEEPARPNTVNLTVVARIDCDNEKVPALPEGRFFADEKTFNDFCDRLKLDAKQRPEIDFDKQLVIIETRDAGDDNLIEYSDKLNDKGELYVDVFSTEKGIRPSDKTEITFLAVNREGITGILRGEWVVLEGKLENKKTLYPIEVNTDTAKLSPEPHELNPDFTPALYQQLKKDEGNVFFSPYSITEAMAMVHAGAGGNTADEIATALALGEGDANDIARRGEALRRHLANLNQGENKLRVANALCVTGEPPRQSYQELVRSRYDGKLFSGGLDEINGWVKEKTEGKIEEILKSLSPDSACVLLNAVYFKGQWETPFDQADTGKSKFHRKPGDEVEVDMMSSESRYRWLDENGLIAVELPYENGAVMVLVMPEKAAGMASLEDRLDAPFLEKTCNKLHKANAYQAVVHVPKFKVSTEYDLIPTMKQLGVSDAFDGSRADFKAMYGEKPVTISQIVHKATLEVDEKGSVASAATAVEILPLAGPRHFRFDRPFLVLIRDRATGTTLFMGRINDPSAG